MSKLLVVLVLVAFSRLSCNTDELERKHPKSAFPDKSGFAVVELFTSEGCSSCPPADDLATEIVLDAEKEKKNVIVLSEHVDYWNRLGWVDPFSNQFYTQRQRWYSGFFASEGIYTPQMIVNGTMSFVGSDRQKAFKNISNSLASSVAFQNIIISTKDARSGLYTYKIVKRNSDEDLNIILVEKYAASKVLRGENKGKTLTHRNIVREWVQIKNPSLEGSVRFKNKLEFSKASVIAFLQNKTTAEITSAGILK
jgi:hypothetical protein